MSAPLKLGWKCKRCQNCGTLRSEYNEPIGIALDKLDAAHTTESDGTCTTIASVRMWFIPAARGPAPTEDAR